MTSNHLFTADLRRRRSHGLVWVIDFGPDEAVSGAGSAALALGEATVFADYERPGRLVRIEIPFGNIDDDEPGQMNAASRGGSFSEPHEAWMARLLGEEVPATLSSSRAPVVTGAARETKFWSPTGQLALLETYLSEIGMPCDGLWALEWLRLAGEAQLIPVLNERTTASVAEAALPLLKALPVDWLVKLDPRAFSAIRGGMNQAVRACEDVRDTEVWRALNARDIEHVVEEIAEAFEPVLLDWPIEQSATQERVPAFLGLPQFLGFGGGFDGRPDVGATEVRTIVDASSAEAIAVSRAETRGETVHVSVVPEHGFEHLVEFMDVRVLSERGLLAAATSLVLDPKSERYEATLTLPLLDDDESLVVVLGLDLPLVDVGEQWFVDTQRALLHRRLRDSLRVGDHGAAEFYFERLEITDRPSSAYSGPFTPELITTENRKDLQSRIESQGGHDLALRHLSFIRGEYLAAAKKHLSFLDGGGENDLSERQLLLLARELGKQGETESTSRLLDLLDY